MAEKENELKSKIQKLQELVNKSSRIVFFGGAGVSTESGIPDFRSRDGLYNQKWKYPPEEIISAPFYFSHTKEFYEFYREKLIIRGIKPNAAHLKLAEWEEKGKLLSIVTQNIDGLHQAAGNKNVWELHGSTLRNFCRKCQKLYDIDFVADKKNDCEEGYPRCPECGGMIKPDVVLYGEGLDPHVIEGACASLAAADLLIIGGTSLTVYPAAGLINYYRGKDIVLINRDPGPGDSSATLVIHHSIGEVLGALA